MFFFNEMQLNYLMQGIEEIICSEIKDETKILEIMKKLHKMKILIDFKKNDVFNWEDAIKQGLLSKRDMEWFDEEIKQEMKSKNVTEVWKYNSHL